MAHPEILISQKMHLLPERAIDEATRLHNEYHKEIGVEIIPLRWHTIDYLVGLQKDSGVKTAIAGVTTATLGDFAHDLWNFKSDLKVSKEILMNLAAIGAQSEPEFTRRFQNHLRLAVAMNASYIAMHEEPTRHLITTNKFEEWTGTDVLYGRKLGWGPQDNRPQIMSWNIHAIRKFVDEWRKTGANIGTILPTDTALRTGLSLPNEKKRYNLMKAWEVLQPRVIQLGDYDPTGKKEKLPLGMGYYSEDIATLIQESSRTSPGTVYTIEVESPEGIRPSLEFLLNNLRNE